MDERQLIDQLRAGDETAVTVWYQLYNERLHALIGRKIDNSADVDEVTQETFISCLRSLPAFAGRSGLWTWMCGIARHEISDFYRKKYAKKVLHALPFSEWLLGDATEKDETHEIFSLQKELCERVEHVLETIGRERGELLQEKYLDQIPVAELARRRGKSAKAMESELYRARQAFMKAYQAGND